MKTPARLLLLLLLEPALAGAAPHAEPADPDSKAKNYKSYFEKDDPSSCRYR
jgi:hypothetical protein